MHVDGGAAIGNTGVRVSGAGHVAAVGVGIHALIFEEISSASTTEHTLAVLFLDLGGVLEQTLQTVDQATGVTESSIT